jgi:hypothetical protein
MGVGRAAPFAIRNAGADEGLLEDFPERNHHKIALVHQRMRDAEVGLIQGYIVVEQDVDIYRSVVIPAIGRFPASSQKALDALCFQKEVARTELCLHTDAGVEEEVVAPESPRLRLNERGLAHHRANPLSDLLYRRVEQFLAMAKIGTQTEIYGMVHFSRSESAASRRSTRTYIRFPPPYCRPPSQGRSHRMQPSPSGAWSMDGRNWPPCCRPARSRMEGR